MNNFYNIESSYPIQNVQNNYLQTGLSNENISTFINKSELVNSDSRYNNLGKNEEFFDANNLTFDPWLTVVIAIVAALMSSITIIGNVFVITAFIIEKSLRKYSNYFILNLSIADLLIGILIPPYAPFLLNKRLWRLGKLACTIWLVLDYVVGSASVLCIVVISLDRYLLVSRGLKYVASQKVLKAILIMLTVWSIAFLNYAPAIIFWELISGRQTVKEGECQVAFHDNLVYLTATACVEFFAPLISICGLNLAVYLNIRKRSRGLIRSENPHFNLEKSINNGSTIKKDEEKSRADLAEKTTRNDDLSKKPNRPFSVSASSTTCSSSSLDDIANNNNNNANNNNNSKLNTKHSKSTNKTHNETSLLLNSESVDKSKPNSDANLLRKKPSFMCPPQDMSNQNACTSLLTPTGGKTQTNNQSNNSYTAYSKAKKNSSTSNRTLTKDKKAARSLFILVFVFVFCWAPYTFLTLIKAVCPTCVNDNAYEFAFWLLWFNSTLNPILYPFLHVKFRKAFLKIIQFILFCFKFKKKGYKPPNTTNINLNSTYKKNDKPSYV